MLQGVVNSKRLEIDKGGEIVRFVGDVTMTLEIMPTLARESAAVVRGDAFAASFRSSLLGCALGERARSQQAPGTKAVPNALQGFSQESRQAGAHRGGVARGARKGQAGDLQRQRSRRAGRHHHALQGAGGSLRQRPARRHEVRATPGAGGASQISRLEAKGGVVVTQTEQTATGDTGLFDMKSNTITLLGNVVVSQGGNVVRGERLVVDMTTGVSKVDAGDQGAGAHADRAEQGRHHDPEDAEVSVVPELIRASIVRRLVETAAACEYHRDRSRKADVLDDILTLFRRRRVPARRTSPAGNNRLSINLRLHGRADLSHARRRDTAGRAAPARHAASRQARSSAAPSPGGLSGQRAGDRAERAAPS